MHFYYFSFYITSILAQIDSLILKNGNYIVGEFKSTDGNSSRGLIDDEVFNFFNIKRTTY